MMDYSKVPDELKNLNQWVCVWDGSKIPMRATERRGASSVDPATWSSFEQAAACVEAEVYDHIGFVFADNGIIGIDIDTGFEDRLMTPLCADIMNHCRSYTEVSRSGRGVHIFLKGTLPFPGKNNMSGVEIYQSKRFFITTGKQICFDRIMENQPAIDYVLDKYFINGDCTRRGLYPGTRTTTPQDNAQHSNFERLSKGTKIYTPEWEKPKKGRFRVSPEYPEIKKGNRNLSMLSIAGQLWKQGYDLAELYKKLCKINQESCKPPLTERELQSICKSISKYER